MASELAAALGASFLLCFACGCARPKCADAPLGTAKPPPARLCVDELRGAEVRIDGTLAGVAPLPRPVEADPGDHVVLVTDSGHEPKTVRVRVARGETRTLSVELEETGQRLASWVLVATGGAGLSAGIVLVVFAVVEHRAAGDLEDDAGEEGLSGADRRA